MKNKIFQGSLILLVLVTAFFSWLSVDRAIRVPEASHWIAPIVWFSFFVIFFCLSVILVKNKQLTFFITLISFSFSLLFAFNFWNFLILIVSLLLAWWGTWAIRNDLGLNVRISLWKSLLTGKTQLIIALALLISSQYFFIVDKMDGQRIMPKFDVSGPVIKAVMPMLGAVNPSFKGLDQEGLTVDQYLLKVQEGNEAGSGIESVGSEFIDAQIPANIPAKQRELLKQEAMKKMSDAQNQLSQKNKDLILTETRKQFSKVVGQELKGNEKLTEVLASMVSKKMNEVMQPEVKEASFVSMLPLIFALVLFLTIAPLGSLLSRVWFLLIMVLFRIFVKLKLVRLEMVQTEKEVIL